MQAAVLSRFEQEGKEIIQKFESLSQASIEDLSLKFNVAAEVGHRLVEDEKESEEKKHVVLRRAEEKEEHEDMHMDDSDVIGEVI